MARLCFAGPLWALVLGGLAGVQAQALELRSAATFTSVQVVSSSSVLTQDLDPGEWFSGSSVGTSLATAAADEGIGRILAATPAADGGTRSASASAEWWVELRNNSDSVVSFAPGAFQAEWSFELSKTESTVGSARFSAIANGSLSTFDAGTSVGYRHFDETGAPAAFVVGAGVRSGGGTFSILSATETSFLARIASGAVDLQPGAGGRVTVTFQVALVAGAGWAGTLDATRSVHLSLALPQGVSIESPRPLGFVTAVPEPSSAVLALLGLALLAAGRRLQRDA